MTALEVLRQYPGLEEADILACIAYGAEMGHWAFLEIADPSDAKNILRAAVWNPSMDGTLR